MLHTEETLETCADTLGSLDKARLIRALARILDLSHREVSSALAVNGRLAMSGLLKVDSSWPREMKSKIDLMSGLAENMFLPDADTTRIFASYFVKGHKPKLGKNDFEHVREPYALIRSYLMKALQKTAGVNILIYGLPGSGKTEMVRSIVRDAGAGLYEISMEDADGDPLSSKERFSAYQLSQQILNREPRSVILFDEIEDVFPESILFGKPSPGSTEKKAWINRLLESNQVPAFWLSNKVHHIDPAFLRRFDYVLEMPAPTSRMRRQMFMRYLGKLPVSEEWLMKMSANRNLLPAHIEKAAKVARHLASRNTKTIESVLDSVLKGTQEILGLRLTQGSLPMATNYSLEFISANVDIPGLVDGLKRSRKGSICFYGPPGTGKT
ncbi:MAG: ATP-binding protein, partial [Mariprofundaceae bacterium]|nr:ATP-binding protein [Mariprofundaceae bacterium]